MRVERSQHAEAATFVGQRRTAPMSRLDMRLLRCAWVTRVGCG